jgi:glutamate/tyrosine decarboxylase-like PLP-dependent enzyme
MTDDPSALFRRAAALATEYRRGIAEAPQRPRHNYSDALVDWEAPTPENGTPAEEMLEELVRRAEPGLHAMTGPRFYGWVIGGSHPAGVAADWLVSAWGQNVGNHAATPAASAAEVVASRWLVDMLGLPAECSVGFVTGATMANFVGLAAARSELLRRANWDVEAHGLFGAPPIRVAVGADAHVSVLSALQFLGLGHSRVLRIATDDEGRMLPDALAHTLAEGVGPVIVILQAGQINSGNFDKFSELIPIARAHGAWVHVDGAFGLWAKACPTRASLAVGVEEADSWATDGHKWLQTPYDCGFAIVRDPEAHGRAMAFGASYLPTVIAGERDPTHYVPELSRRARGMTTWAMLRHLGRAGIAELVERNCQCAQLIASGVGAEPGIAVANQVVLNQAVLRFGGDVPTRIGDELTLRTISRLQEDGTCFAGASQWRGQWVMRVSVSGYATTPADARRSAEAITVAWRAVQGQNSGAGQ